MKHILLLTIIAAFGLCACTPMEEKRDAHMEKAKAFSASDNCADAKKEAQAALDLDKAIPGAFLIMGRCDLKAEDYPAAAANFAEVLKLMPDAVEALEGSTRAALMQDDVEKAEEYAAKAVLLEDKSAELAILRAGILMKKGNYDGAIPFLQQAVDTDPKNEEALIGLASAYINTGQKDNASAILQKSLEAIPQSSALYSLLTNFALQEKDFPAAEKYIRKQMELNPQESRFTLQLADIRFMEGRNDEGVTVLDDYLKAHPEADTIRTRLSSVYATQNNFEKATSVLSSAPQQTPLIKLHTASVAGRAGKLPEAIDLLKKLVADPQAKEVEEDARFGLVEIYLQQEKLKEADEELTQLLKANGDNPEALALRGRVRFSLQQSADAIKDLEQAADLSGDPQSLLALAEAYIASGNPKEGENILTQLLSQYPELSHPYLALANLHLMRNSPEAALLILGIGKKSVPNDPNIVLTEADILAKLGRTKESVASLEELGKKKEFTEAAMMRIGAIQGEAKNHDKAAAAYERALAANPESTQAAEGRIRALLAAGKGKAALTFAEKRMEDRPNDPAAAYLMGEAGLANKNRDKAFQGFLKAIDLAPEWDQPLTVMAQLYRAQGKTADAIKLAQKSMVKAPDASAPALVYAMLQEQQENFTEATKVYREVLAKHPDTPVAASNLAFLLVLGKDASPEAVQEAQGLARKALDSGITAARDTLGWTQYLSGNVTEAEQTLRQSKQEMSSSPLVDYHLAAVLADLAKKGGENSAAQIEEAKALLLGIIMQPIEFAQKKDARELLDSLSKQ